MGRKNKREREEPRPIDRPPPNPCQRECVLDKGCYWYEQCRRREDV